MVQQNVLLPHQNAPRAAFERGLAKGNVSSEAMPVAGPWNVELGVTFRTPIEILRLAGRALSSAVP